ncbi:MAG: molybdopterin-dependent oxidoreductase [Anaerolineae bacterium]|nr:molybdopterin-dependent oxidoreductase [Anaerolineae bacterium]
MSKNERTDLLTQLNSATLNRRSFLKWSTAVGATAMLASKVDLLDGIYPLSTALAQAETKIIPTGCAHNCGGRCVLKAHVKDGVVVRVTSDTDRPDDPMDPQLRACVRGRSYRRRVYAPDRLRSPLRRKGPRGSGLFEEISWEEAIDTVAENLIRIKEQYGNSAIYSHYSTGAYTNICGAAPVGRMLNLFGGTLGYYNNYSWACVQVATPTVYGTQNTGQSRLDWLNTRLILMWGWNPAEMIDGTNTMYFVKMARQAGAKTILIDPRHSMSAVGLADEWIPIRPGTDAAMMAAMAYVMITEGLVDEDFVNRYALGYDAQHMPEGYENAESFKAYILGESDGTPKTPEWAEAITGVPAATIARIGREYATTKPAMLYQGYGIQRRAYGEQVVRMGCVLPVLTGNIGISGGWASGIAFAISAEGTPGAGFPSVANPVPYSIPSFLFTDAILRGKEMGRADGVRGLADGEETLPNSIKFLYNPAGNCIVNQHGNVNRTIEILKDESLAEFIVSHEHFLTPSARYSDIVLPACTFWETWGMASNWKYSPSRILMPQVIEPLYGTKSDYAICAMIAERLGIYDEFTEGGKTELDWYNQWVDQLVNEYGNIYGNRESFEARGSMTVPYTENPPVAFADFIADPAAKPLSTPSGLIEIFSTAMAAVNKPEEVPPIPKYIQEWESPFGPEAEEYPLQAIGHHYMHRIHSTFDNIDWMEEAFPQRVFMNPIDAEARGIKDGDLVRVFNNRGSMLLPARVTPRIMPGVVNVPQGGWYTPDANGVDRRGCVNVLTSERPSPYAFGNTQQTIMVQVEKA